jgi:hypothetical protein
VIKQAIDDGAYSYEAEYEGTWGYPIQLTVNFRTSSLVDVSFTVTEFATLPQP